MKVEEKLEELQASIQVAAAAAASSGTSADGAASSARDDAQDRATEDMDLRITHLEGAAQSSLSFACLGSDVVHHLIDQNSLTMMCC
jgi:hypothetical protein